MVIGNVTIRWSAYDFLLTFYSNYVSIVVSGIFNVEKYRDLEIPLKGQSRKLKVVPFDRLCMFPYSKFVHKMHRFSDIRLVSVQ